MATIQDTYADSSLLGTILGGEVASGVLRPVNFVRNNVDFDFADYISVPSALGGVSGATNTVMFWLDLDAFDSGGVVVFGTNTTTPVFWQIVSDMAAAIQNAVVTTYDSNYATIGWAHIAFTSDGTTHRVYVNGIFVGSSTAADTALAAGAKNFAIGDWIGGLNGLFSLDGKLTDVRFCNSTLTAAQVRYAYYTALNAVTPTNWWKLDEGTGTTATDSGSAPTNGTFVNSPTWATATRYAIQAVFPSTNLLSGLGATSVSTLAYTLAAKPSGTFGHMLFSSDGLTWKNSLGVDCSRNGCYFFDGVNDHINVGNVALLNFERTDSFSIRARFRVFPNGDQRWSTIASKMLDASTGWWLGVGENGSTEANTPGRVRFILRNTNTTNSLDVSTDTSTYNDGLWHTVVVTYAGTSLSTGIKIYVDGALVSHTALFDNLTSSIQTSAQVGIGNLNNGGGADDWCYGWQADIAIYAGDVLSADTVTAWHNFSTEPSETKDGWWPLAEDANDYSGNANHGTATGGAELQQGYYIAPPLGDLLTGSATVQTEIDLSACGFTSAFYYQAILNGSISARPTLDEVTVTYEAASTKRNLTLLGVG